MSSKNYAIFWGGGGEVIKRSHWITGGRGGGQDGPKKDHVIFECSLITDFKIDFQNKKWNYFYHIEILLLQNVTYFLKEP